MASINVPLRRVQPGGSLLTAQTSDTFGDVPAFTEWYPKVAVCDTLKAFDFALLAAFRVRKFNAKLSYNTQIETTYRDAGGTPVKRTHQDGASGTHDKIYEAKTSLVGGDFLNLDENVLLAAAFGGYGPQESTFGQGLSGGIIFSPEDDGGGGGLPDYCRVVILADGNSPHGKLPFLLTCDLFMEFRFDEALGAGDAPYVAQRGGTQALPTDTVPVEIKFHGKTFGGYSAKYTPQPDFDTGGTPASSSELKRYIPTKLEITGKEFWSHGGKFNTQTGAPS